MMETKEMKPTTTAKSLRWYWSQPENGRSIEDCERIATANRHDIPDRRWDRDWICWMR